MTNFPLRKFLTDFLFVQFRSWFAVAIGIITSSLIARALGPEGRGILALSILVPTFLGTLLNFGVSPANVYAISTSRFTAPVVFRASIQIWIWLSLIGLISGYFVLSVWGPIFFSNVPESYLFACLVLFPVNLISEFSKSILQGQQRFKEYNLASLALPVLSLIFIYLFLWVLNFGIWGAISTQLLCTLIALAITMVLLGKVVWSANPKNTVADCRRHSFSYGFRANLSNIMAFVNYRADIFILNLFFTPSVAGIYMIAVGLAEKLWLLSQGISTVLLPKLGELHKVEEKQRELTPFVARWVLLVTSAGAILTWLIISHIILFLYGHAFLAATEPFRILLIGITLGASSRVLANDLAARGKPELNFYASVIIVTINIVLNILLIPRMGINGAAISTTTAYSVNFFIKIFLYQHVSKCSFRQLFLPNSLDNRAFKFIMHQVRTR